MKIKVGKRWITLVISLLLPVGMGLKTTPAVAAGISGGEFSLTAEYRGEMKNSHPRPVYSLALKTQQAETGVGFYIDLNIGGDLRQLQPQLEIGEAYLDFSGENHELRIGRQRRAWGAALEINPTDNLNPPNPADPFGEKEPVIMVAGDYYLSNTHTLTGVIIPFHQPAVHKILLPAGMFEADPVVDDWTNTQYAVRISGKGVYGWDYALCYLRGFEALPFVKIKKTSTGPVPERIYFREYQVVGLDLATGLGGAGLWTEAAYFFPREGDQYYTAVAGGDYKFGTGLYLVGQLVFKKDRMQNKELLLQQALELPIAAIHSLRFGSLYNTETGGFMLRPEAEISVGDDASLTLAYRYVEGDLFTEMSEGNIKGNSFNVGFSYCF